MVAFNVGFLMVVFLMLVFYSAWFFVFGLLFCCMFFDSKTRLTCKSNFFQLIFLVIVRYRGQGEGYFG